ncbi:MAG: hypothetical protein R3330_15160, partial [Saprospiraceae bacterium]|nr:hypothetical protein [Saprospiraceae bacterium]
VAAGWQVDIDNDSFVDLCLTVLYSIEWDQLRYKSFVLRSAGNFTFTDSEGKWKSVVISYPDAPPIEPGRGVESPDKLPRMTGISDFNLDGIDDLFIMPGAANDPKTGDPIYSYIIYGSPDLFDQNIELKLQDDQFKQGMAIEGLLGLGDTPYATSAAGDLNGDGYGDIMIADVVHNLAYGIYGQRLEDNSETDYVKGSEDDDVLLQSNSLKQVININGKGGNDFIQTLRTVQASTRPYTVVVHGGPGDDQIGISTVQSDHIKRIDGGSGFDKLFLNPLYSGGEVTLDLTDVGRRISSIELIDLGDSNGLEFGFLEVRNLTSESNTLLIQGTNARAKAVDSDKWFYNGQSAHQGVVYNIYNYQPENGSSNIQVWLEDGGVSWSPIQ